MKIRIVLLTVLGLAGAPLVARERVGVHVTPNLAFAPADLKVLASVPGDEANRAVEVIAESPNFYSSSEIQLNGESAPRTTTVEFRSLPVGRYSVRVVVKGTSGKEIASARTDVSVLGR